MTRAVSSQSIATFAIHWMCAALSIIALLASCAKYEPVSPPSLSPAASNQGTIHLTLSVTPGTDEGPGTKADAIYGMTNERQCSPKDYSSAIGGRWNHVSHTVKVNVVQENQYTYIARVPTHPMEDEDYYGLGVCRWVLSAVVFDFGSSYVAVHAKNIEMGHAEFICTRDGRGRIAKCAERSSVRAGEQAGRELITVNIDKE